MSTVSENKKFVHLEGVKVYYNRKNDTIQIICTDDDVVGLPFQVTLNKGTDTESTLRSILINKGVINIEESQKMIPKFVRYDDDKELRKIELKNISDYSKESETTRGAWNEIPLGVIANSNTLSWDILRDDSPVSLIVGWPGTGKTVIQNNIISHCINYKNKWETLNIDETYITKAKASKSGITQFLIKDLKAVTKIINTRLSLMKKQKVENFEDIKNNKAVLRHMIAIHGLDNLLEPLESKDENARKLVSDLLSYIIENGASAGVYLNISVKDPQSLEPNFLRNISTHIILERSNGRGIINSSSLILNGKTIEYQESLKIQFYAPRNVHLPINNV